MRRIALIVLSALFCIPVFAAESKPSLPPWFPSTAGLFEVSDFDYRAYDEWTFLTLDHSPLPKNSGGYTPVAGRVWTFVASKAKPNYWPTVRGLLERQGFAVAHGDPKDPDPGMISLAKGDPAHATYVEYWNHAKFAIIETAPNPFHVTLKPPAAAPQTLDAKTDIPYLSPLPGSTLKEGDNKRDGALRVKLPNGDREWRGSDHMVRVYNGPAGLSTFAAMQAYEAALKAAGWEVIVDGTSNLTTHFAKNGRDIWADFDFAPLSYSTRYGFEVVDAGSSLREQLKKNCKAALYGVNFDFNKATLRTDAEPALNQVLALLKDDPKLKVEIGGHTDNVGTPAYNLKLSDERAAAVRQWLVAHGIAASRLTSHGYGDKEPLVPNTSDENRFKNRRVEVKRTDCK